MQERETGITTAGKIEQKERGSNKHKREKREDDGRETRGLQSTTGA